MSKRISLNKELEVAIAVASVLGLSTEDDNLFDLLEYINIDGICEYYEDDIAELKEMER